MIPVTIENTFGAIEVGSFGAAFLFGVITLQCCVYYSQYPQDTKVTRVLVPILWALECTHTVLILWEVYRLTIIFSGRAGEVAQYPGFSAVLMLSGFITAIVQARHDDISRQLTSEQCFFAFRVWKLLPRSYSYIGLACGVASITRAVMGTYGSIEAFIMPSYPEFLVKFENYLTALLALGAVIDVINAASLSYFLIMHRQKSFYKTTNLIDRLVAYTIRTGVITSVAAITVLVLFQVLSPTFISLAIYVALAKLYSISLLCALNERQSLKEEYSKSLSVSRPRIAVADTSLNGIGPKTNQAISVEMKPTPLISEDPSDDQLYDLESKRHPISPLSNSPNGRRSHIV